MAHVHGVNRSQSSLFPESLDDFIGPEHIVRLIDGFVSTLDLVALSAMTCVAASLVLPRMWTMALLGILAAIVAALKPAYAQHLSSAVVVVTTITSLLLWNRAAAVRTPRSIPGMPPPPSKPE